MANMSVRGTDRTIMAIGSGIGLLPFFASFSVATPTSYRDYVAIVAGPIAATAGVVATVLAVKNRAGAARIGLACGALALGGLDLAKGFGVFAGMGDDVAMDTFAHEPTK